VVKEDHQITQRHEITKKIDDSTIITNVLYNLLNILKHIKSTSNSVPKGLRKDLDLLTL
jgi:hypothetical protein